jgi:hypothetical protein
MRCKGFVASQVTWMVNYFTTEYPKVSAIEPACDATICSTNLARVDDCNVSRQAASQIRARQQDGLALGMPP